MLNRKTSAYISLVILLLSALALATLLCCFPQFFRWFYAGYHGLSPRLPAVSRNIRIVTVAFYASTPFAAAALAMLIRLQLNVIRDRPFITQNVSCLRGVSWCCYAVAAITLASGRLYMPLWLICAAMAVVGTLVRVIKNVMQAAVELREEQDLTI